MQEPFEHQASTTQFILDNPRVLITSDPGTGKTRSVLDAFSQRKTKKLLVLAPLSILAASWGDDCDKFQPSLTYSIAYARNRADAFKEDVDIVITNHDAVKWLLKNKHYLDAFDTVCIDEFTAFKNKDSQRSKAMAKLIDHFEYRIAMSGTPNSNTILDIWHPALLVDDGQRLGKRFYGFRGSVCNPQFNGFANVWVDKPEAQDMVAAAIKDINVRYTLEDCIDMPEQSINTMYVDLPKKILDQYNILAEDSVLYTKTGTVNAIHAGAKVKKLLQLCTGAVYDDHGSPIMIHDERYQLVMDLVQGRNHSLVAFNWRHEREKLTELSDKLGIKYDFIDGTTPAKKRKDIVDRMQAGQLKVVFAHPQSAGHGLTLTRATSVIWASPTYNAEHYQQFNRRIYRAGQTKKTEVIQIASRNTWEPDVYKKLQDKLGRMEDLLEILNNLNQLKETA
ncbi:DEAD/DEAH box helicase [Limnobacter sp.]|uniref:DEAD/DEAH box helicase n=1 Tax=Limnobacter sp. TaxID=2003368 RepID=UPI0025BA734D|nr:DEAD/DEAH box helicase [Limnobacter sp.]